MINHWTTIALTTSRPLDTVYGRIKWEHCERGIDDDLTEPDRLKPGSKTATCVFPSGTAPKNVLFRALLQKWKISFPCWKFQFFCCEIEKLLQSINVWFAWYIWISLNVATLGGTSSVANFWPKKEYLLMTIHLTFYMIFPCTLDKPWT